MDSKAFFTMVLQGTIGKSLQLMIEVAWESQFTHSAAPDVEKVVGGTMAQVESVKHIRIECIIQIER